MTNSSFKPTSNTKPKPLYQHANFIEALKNIGTGTAKSLKDDLIKGTATDVINNTISPSAPNHYPEANYSPDMFTPDWLNNRDNDIETEVARRQRHQEINLTPLFDRRDEEIKTQIKALREELALLAQDLNKLGHSVQNAIEQEIAQPGVYHINFFEKLKKFIITLRKQVNDSASWLEVSYQRRQAKKHYWGGVKKSGTKFMLSHDRAVATQTG